MHTGIEVSRLDGSTLTPAFSLPETEGRIYGGNEQYALLLANDAGLYGLQADGAGEAIIIWRDCGIAISRLAGILPLPEGRFLMLDSVCDSVLSPASPDDMHSRVPLVIAAVGSGDSLRALAARFNMSNSEYTIEVKDYSDGGAYDTASAVTRLNTDIISGKYPDLFSFSGMPPFALINKGCLLDMIALMGDDPEVSEKDIVIAKQLSAADRVKENPESEVLSELDFTPTEKRLRERTLYTAKFMIGDVGALADFEGRVGCRLSTIGQPTVDGSCGSDIYLHMPVGICSQTDNAGGCWKFIKYLLLSAETSDLLLPAYAPYLQSRLDKALGTELESGAKITQADEKRLLELLDKIEAVELYDETALAIIEEEASAFFTGQKSAEETAAVIQSRMQIYVSEQS